MWIDDQVIQESEHPLVVKVLIPKTPAIVLGRSNRAEEECHVDKAKKLGVEILQRYGGGGTVVLYPGSLVISIGAWVKERFRNDYFFKLINQGILDFLSLKAPHLAGRFGQAGISDLTLDGLKFGGTSLFRSRNYLLYQASLLIELDIELISKVLKHPSREPGYREKRSHEDFLVGLSQKWPQMDTALLCEMFHKDGMKIFGDALAEEITDARLDQRPHLLRKIQEPNS